MLTVDFNTIHLKPGMRVLDAGCGGGRHLCEAFRTSGVAVAGVDLSWADLCKAKGFLALMGRERPGNWIITRADIGDLPYADGSFDVVICSEVLEHLPDERAAVAELVRVLKPGGDLVVTVPRYLPERVCWALSRAYHREPGGHIRIYRKRELMHLLEKAGTRCWRIRYRHGLHAPYWWLRCLVGHTNERSQPVRLYRRFLEWDILRHPPPDGTVRPDTEPSYRQKHRLLPEKRIPLMELHLMPTAAASTVDVPAMADFIAGLQKANGEIPWSDGGKTDPWDHVESAMGLCVAGRQREAERAYGWLAATQLPDGSWWSATRDGDIEDGTRDSNVSSYIAVGMYHHFLITGDVGFLKRLWPTIESGVDYAVGLQADNGAIHWARNRAGVVDRMALLTGSSSVYMSLKCAIAIALLLGRRRTDWECALKKLGAAIRFRPNLFNMMKSRYSMDWYYPVLCGAVTGEDARVRIDRSWEKFVVPDWGVRCVSDQPWVTTAEAAELVLALAATGERERAAIVFNWICDKKYEDGSYWMGVTFPDGVIWPEERTSWTAAAVLLAHDALHDLTRASRLFSHEFWRGTGIGRAIASDGSPCSVKLRKETDFAPVPG